MTLPVIDKPIYKTTILSHKGEIEFTPFTVKESKILMMARESDEISTIVDALRQVLQNCLVTQLDVSKLAMVDLEWLYLQIHARSFGEKLPLVFSCTTKVQKDGKEVECGMVIKHEVNLLNVEIKNREAKRDVSLNDKYMVRMRFPTFEATQAIIKSDDSVRDPLLIAMSIDSVITETEVVSTATMNQDEVVAWVDKLPAAKYQQMEEFLRNAPTIQCPIEATCSKCGTHHKITLEGLEDFFA